MTGSHAYGCACTACSACAGLPDFGYLAGPTYLPATQYTATRGPFVHHTPMIPALSPWRPFGAFDPAIITSAVEAATAITTTSIALAKDAKAEKDAKAAKAKAAKAKAAKAKAAPALAPVAVALAPVPAKSNTALYVGGAVGVAALLALVVVMVKKKAPENRK